MEKAVEWIDLFQQGFGRKAKEPRGMTVPASAVLVGASRTLVMLVLDRLAFIACTCSSTVVRMLSHGGVPSPKVAAAFRKLTSSWRTSGRV